MSAVTGKNLLTEVLEFGDDLSHVVPGEIGVGGPLHLVEESLQVTPFESHQGAFALAEACVETSVCSDVIVERALNWLSMAGIAAGSRFRISGIAATALFLASDTVSEVAIVACALEATGGVLACGLWVAIVLGLALLVRRALVNIGAFLVLLVVPVADRADARASSAFGSCSAVGVAFGGFLAVKSITFVTLGANACVSVCVGICDTVSMLVTASTWVFNDFIVTADSVVAALSLVTLDIVALISRFALVANHLEATLALALALVVSVSILEGEFLSVFWAGKINAWIDVDVTAKAVSSETLVANAVVILLTGDLFVWNAGSIIVAVVLSASINWVTLETITSVSSLALADVVVDGADEGGVAGSVVVATSSVDGAGVDLDTFVVFLDVSLHAVAFVSWAEVGASRVSWAKS